MDVDLETIIDPNDMMITNNWETVQHYKDTCYSCNVGRYLLSNKKYSQMKKGLLSTMVTRTKLFHQ